MRYVVIAEEVVIGKVVGRMGTLVAGGGGVVIISVVCSKVEVE